MTPETAEVWDSWVAFRRRRLRVPGVQVAVWADGAQVLSRAHGHADPAHDVALTTDHLFRVASHSKTFTATVVLRLAADGRLRLDDTLADHLGADVAPGEVGRVRVRDLLGHTSGLVRDGVDGDHWQLARPFPDRDALRAVLADPRTAVLGRQEAFKYSNIGYGALGLVVEEVTGGSWADAVRAGVIDRIGLTATTPEPDADEAGRLVTGHTALAYADERVPIDDTDAGALGAATGVCSTASDLVRYLAAHVEGDTLLPDEWRREMRGVARDTDRDQRYGLGLDLVTRGERSLVGHSGGWPGQLTSTLADDDAGIVVSALTNAVDGPAGELVRGFFALLDLAEAAEPDPAGPDALGAYTGRFASVWGVVDVVVLGGRLHLLDPTGGDPGDRPFTLEVTGADTLRVASGSGFGSVGETLTYERDDTGAVRSLRGPNGTTLRPLDAFELPGRVVLGHRP